MSKLSTTDIPESGTGVPKTLQPGNTTIKVESISLRKEPFEGDPLQIILQVEGEPIKDFEGFFIDKDKPELGHYLGQVARVRATEYNFNTITVNGKVIDRDQEILKWVQRFCKTINKPEWLANQHNKFDTIDELIGQLNEDKPFKDIWLDVCFAARPYTNSSGFLNYDLYFPYATTIAVPMELKGINSGKLIKFNADLHIKSGKKKAEPTAGFTGKKGKGDFDL